ncbi:MAG TPA: XRE family transcriptional regulator [Inquilinus sp.]|jgi:phage repressor protein C with HTH and peptisase S24 domain|nr:XRE family transcriptional regulator [Inquilinus sp.]
MGNGLKRLRLARAWTHEQAAEAMAISRSQFIKLERGERRLTADYIRQAAEAFGAGELEVMGAAGTVPLVGKVGAGAEVHLFDGDASSEQIDEVDAPPGADETTVAVIVSGDSMFPRYLERETIYYRRADASADPTSLIGREVVVRLADGRTFVKVLRRGSSPGYFTLDSYNAAPMEDVVVEWVVPVKWVKRD